MIASKWSPILLVAAHPDDEAIGAAIRLSRWDPAQVTILHITDGSPRDLHDAHKAGFFNRQDYSHQRRRELYAALELINMRPDQCMTFKYPDQETHLHLAELTDRLTALVMQLKPGVLYTHPYEGGHPDHDSAAFAVAHANAPKVMEFTSYHEGPDGMISGEFLNGGATETIEFTDDERHLKERILRCYRSQQKVLSEFKVEREKFRPAPRYDFSEAPHPGPLHYEKLGWDVSGEDWRRKAAEALELLRDKAVL